MTTPHVVPREEVMAYVDGELPAARASVVGEHLESCDECRSVASEFRQLSSRLATWQVEIPPAPLDEAPSRVAQPPSRSRAAVLAWLSSRTLGLPRWVFAAMPAIALLLIVISWQNESFDPSTTLTSRESQESFVKSTQASGPRVDQANERSVAAIAGRPVPAPLARLEASETVAQQATDGPMIARTATIGLVTDKFDDMRAALERLTTSLSGTIGSLEVTGEPSNHRAIRASLRVPAGKLDGALGQLRALGRVRHESQASEDIGDAHRDLVVRIANAKREETRLNDILANRTGRLSDVLAVEREVTRVRGEVESMESQELSMRTRVTFSTISVQIDELYRAELALNELPLSTRLRNAVVDGWRDAAAGLVSALIELLVVLPTLLVWIVILGLPAWLLVKRLRATRRQTIAAERS